MTYLRTSLVWKLTLAFILVAITTAGLVAIFIRRTSIDRLSSLIIDQQRSTLLQNLQEYYNSTGSWANISQQWNLMRIRPLSTSQTGGQPDGSPPFDFFVPNQGPSARDRRHLFGLADQAGRVIISVDPTQPQGTLLPASDLQGGTPITVNGTQVGTILTAPFQPRFNPEEYLFIQRTTQALLLAVLGSVMVALVLGVLLARTLTLPLQALTEASHNIASGQLEQQVEVKTHDEIGQLAAAFNRMSQEVTRVNQMRRQMTADIAHDLRTPLTVIAGYVESMRDGVLQPTPERLSLIYAEIERLQNLVGDLKMLSQVDAGELPLHPRNTSPQKLLERMAAPFGTRAEQQGVRLEVLAPGNLPDVNVDDARMMQVFGNLISNALRYTPEGGQITLSAQRVDGEVQLAVQDTGEGIDESELEHIFDRFHRADKSRHADAGETGLGLAIVKALVEAHGGRVWAESKPDEGTAIRIALPAQETSNSD